jgi:acrylyl-CoA reductase (NADPH)
LPTGDVTVAVAVAVAVEYSTINYKDGLCMRARGLVRKYPHVPGIDFAGTVEASEQSRYKPGAKVVLTGWRVGETHRGGLSRKRLASMRIGWCHCLMD